MAKLIKPTLTVKQQFDKKLGDLYMKALKTESIARKKKYIEEIDALTKLREKFLKK